MQCDRRVNALCNVSKINTFGNKSSHSVDGMYEVSQWNYLIKTACKSENGFSAAFNNKKRINKNQ